jgi:hypothetical protein
MPLVGRGGEKAVLPDGDRSLRVLRGGAGIAARRCLPPCAGTDAAPPAPVSAAVDRRRGAARSGGPARDDAGARKLRCDAGLRSPRRRILGRPGRASGSGPPPAVRGHVAVGRRASRAHRRRRRRPLTRARGELSSASGLSRAPAPTSVDVPVASEDADAIVTFRVRGGDVAVGEARLLAPDPDGATPHPWVVLVVGDALRADALLDPALSRGAPALRAFASAGQRFTNAVTPGCHTRASVWSLMSGRDMMRIDPCLRGGVNPKFAGPRAHPSLRQPVLHAIRLASRIPHGVPGQQRILRRLAGVPSSQGPGQLGFGHRGDDRGPALALRALCGRARGGRLLRVRHPFRLQRARAPRPRAGMRRRDPRRRRSLQLRGEGRALRRGAGGLRARAGPGRALRTGPSRS